MFNLLFWFCFFQLLCANFNFFLCFSRFTFFSYLSSSIFNFLCLFQ